MLKHIVVEPLQKRGLTAMCFKTFVKKVKKLLMAIHGS